MTMVTAEWIAVPYPTPGAAFNNGGTIDATDEKVALVFEAPKTGNIDRVCFRTATVTTGCTVDVRLETVSTTDGNPTGTLVGTNTNASQVIGNNDDNVWFEVILTAAAAVTRGEKYALVIVWGTGGNLVIAAGVGNTTTLHHAFPYATAFTGGAWGRSGVVPLVMAVRYDDASYPLIPGALPVSNSTTDNISTSTTPDEMGNKFVLPFKCRASGAWFSMANTANGDFQVVLYDSGSSVLATSTFDAEMDRAQSNVHLFRTLFNTSVVLDAGATYRLVIKPTTTTAVAPDGLICPSTSLFAAMPNGSAIQKTERTDAGSWTDTNTRRIQIGLILDQLDDGAGGGGGTNVFIHTE